VFTFTGCWNAPEYLVPQPIPEPEDVVGVWLNPDDGGGIDFHADGTCRITDIPKGALWLEPPGPDGKPTGQPFTSDCSWQVEDERPAIDLGLDELKWGTTIAVRGYDGTELGFYLGDPDQRDVYVLEKQPVR
jgi:hypothetical protein